IGHFTFTLAILAAALASLPKKDAELAPAMTAALGGVLSWMALSALIASVVTLIIQVLKTRFIKQRQAGKTVEPQTTIALILCALPIIPGALAVLFCLRAGTILMKEVTSLPSVAQAFSLLL